MSSYALLDPLHRPSSGEVSWTTGNVGEAIPGVQTPLSFTFWTEAFERTVRGSYAEMGVLPRSQAHYRPQSADEAALGVFYGRPALNVNLILEVGAGLPGVTALEVARNVLGTEDLAYIPPNKPARYPVVAVRLPWLAARLHRRMRHLGDQVRTQWSTWAATPPTADEARAALPAVHELFTLSLLSHSHATFLAQACYEQLEKLAAAAGQATVLSDLLSGYGGMVEVGMLQQLWNVAHGRDSMDTFLASYGYHGPHAGNLKSRSWREEPARLQKTCQTYRAVSEHEAPKSVESRRGAVRKRAEESLLRALPAHRRPGARLLFRLAKAFIPLREVGKSMYLQAGDTARIGFRVIGRDLAARGVLAVPEDVFFLTFDEVQRPDVGTLTATIEERRTRFAQYLGQDIPPLFTGTPTPTSSDRPLTERSSALAGIGASAGVVEGVARVIADPTADIDAMTPGEILVASATDPSWTTLFLGASAVVIDVGGSLSHGAIVARELGIPCVTNVGNATAHLRTGDRIRVDGGTGSVTVLEAAESPEEV